MKEGPGLSERGDGERGIFENEMRGRGGGSKSCIIRMGSNSVMRVTLSFSGWGNREWYGALTSCKEKLDETPHQPGEGREAKEKGELGRNFAC